MAEELNNLKALLIGGEGAPQFAPNGLLAVRQMSIERLARASNVTRTAVYNYINKVNRPTIEVLRRMCEALGIPLDLGFQYCTPTELGRPRMKKKKDEKV